MGYLSCSALVVSINLKTMTISGVGNFSVIIFSDIAFLPFSSFFVPDTHHNVWVSLSISIFALFFPYFCQSKTRHSV